MKALSLKVVQLSYITAGSTFLLQHLNQSVKRAVKARYRGRLVERLFLDMLQKSETTIKTRTAIEMLTGS